MKLTEFPLEIQEGLCAHEAFRRLGFEPNEIFICYDPSVCTISSILRTQGKEFSVLIGPTKLLAEEFVENWTKASVVFNETASNEEILDLWDISVVKYQLSEIIFRLEQKGIIIPYFINLSKSSNKELLN